MTIIFSYLLLQYNNNVSNGNGNRFIILWPRFALNTEHCLDNCDNNNNEMGKGKKKRTNQMDGIVIAIHITWRFQMFTIIFFHMKPIEC